MNFYLLAHTQNCSKYAVLLFCDLILVYPSSSSFVVSKSSVGRSSFGLGMTYSIVDEEKYPWDDPLSDSLLYPCHSLYKFNELLTNNLLNDYVMKIPVV